MLASITPSPSVVSFRSLDKILQKVKYITSEFKSRLWVRLFNTEPKQALKHLIWLYQILPETTSSFLPSSYFIHLNQPGWPSGSPRACRICIVEICDITLEDCDDTVEHCNVITELRCNKITMMS